MASQRRFSPRPQPQYHAESRDRGREDRSSSAMLEPQTARRVPAGTAIRRSDRGPTPRSPAHLHRGSRNDATSAPSGTTPPRVRSRALPPHTARPPQIGGRAGEKTASYRLNTRNPDNAAAFFR